MKQATQNPAYHDAKEFEPPPGIVTIPVQMTATLPSGGESTVVRNECFIEGTEPQGQSPGREGGGILSRLFHSRNSTTLPVAAATPPVGEAHGSPSTSNPDAPQPSEEKKGGVLKKFLTIFKGKGSKPTPPPEPPKKSQPEG